MNNRNKHVDDLFSEKANAHKADASFAKMDFEAIKASLPTAPSFVATPKAKPTSWFGLNTIMATVGIVAAVGFIFLWNKGTFTKKETHNAVIASNNTSSKIDTLIAHTNIISTDNSKNDSSISNQLNNKASTIFIDSNKTNLQPKGILSVNDINNNATANTSKENLIVMQNFFSKLSNASQFFTINASKDTIIICNNGTALNIKANSFTHQNKALVKGKVQLEIKEAYSFTDVIAHALHTVSNSNLLESAGMVFMNASQEDSKLEINIRNPTKLQRYRTGFK